MDKYYEMFRGKNHLNKTDFFNRTEDSGEEEWVVCERETSLSFIKITQSVIY